MTITQEAEKIITGERRKAYGAVDTSFQQIAKIWSGILNHEVTPQQVTLLMIGLKLQRESSSHCRDNLVDIIGYTLLNDKLNEK